MHLKLLFSSMITITFIDISSPLDLQAEHEGNLMNKLCIASLKSQINLKNKQKTAEMVHFTCECFFRKYKSGFSLKKSRLYCRNKATEKYNL